ncbi:type IA DNA topoisomerase, partial [Exiguobacterium sp. 8H]|uniref:type IA DNA topoisomerase n=1 Tax=Exiguobacterium sp. 8H TaxID=2653140 RepID=UPI00135703B4
MAKLLILAEKPAVGRAIAETLFPGAKRADGYLDHPDARITWAIGHLVTLAEPEDYHPEWARWDADTLPMVPDPFRLKPVEKTKDQLKKIRQAAKGCDAIVNACDSGREGEAIFRFIYDHLGLTLPIRRLWTPSLTEEGLKKAWADLRDGRDYEALYAAARARSEADWLVGLNATRAFTTRHGGHGVVYSIGRVQTPVLAMVHDRDVAIQAFRPETYHVPTLTLDQQGNRFEATWSGEHPTGRLTKEEAGRISGQAHGATVTLDPRRDTARRQVPLLHSLSTLQTEANRLYGYSADETLKTAQALYETHKLLTYPRTSANHVTEDEAGMIRALVPKVVGRHPVAGQVDVERALGSKRFVDASKVEDHHALLPTGKPWPDGLGEKERNVLTLVERRLIAHCLPVETKERVTVDIEAGGEPFRARFAQVVDPGWTVLFRGEEDETDKDKEDATLPPGMQIVPGPATVVVATTKERVTRPPVPYTEGTLIQAMKQAGRHIEDEEARESAKGLEIGTEATRAATIERLKKVGYIRPDGKKLCVTDKGRAVIQLARSSGLHLLTSPEMTAKWESALGLVAKGEVDAKAFVKKVEAFVRHLVTTVKTQEGTETTRRLQETADRDRVVGTCPECGGDVVERKNSYSCENESCLVVLWKQIAGKTLTPSHAKTLLAGGTVGPFKMTSKQKRPFEAALTYKKSGDAGLYKLEFVFGKKSGTGRKRTSRKQGAVADDMAGMPKGAQALLD